MKRFADIRLSADGLIHQEHAPEPVTKQKGKPCQYDREEVCTCLNCTKDYCSGERRCMKKEMKRKEKENERKED